MGYFIFIVSITEEEPGEELYLILSVPTWQHRALDSFDYMNNLLNSLLAWQAALRRLKPAATNQERKKPLRVQSVRRDQTFREFNLNENLSMFQEGNAILI